MDKQELINILKSQSSTFSEDVERKLEYLNSDEVFSEYTSDLDENLEEDFEDEIDDDDDFDDDDDDDEDDDDDDDEDDEDGETENVDPETLKKQKLAAKIAAMRGLSAPQFLKK